MKTTYLKNKGIITNNLLIIIILLCTQSLFSQQIGDPGWVFDDSKSDNKYPIMKTFVNAGVQGGIPYRSSLQIKKTISAGGNIQSGINDVANQGGGVLLLKNGKYKVSSGVNLKSNVVVRGESKAGVVIEVTMRGSGTKSKKDAFTFGGISKAGIEDLTMKFIASGAEPQDDLNNSTGSWCKKCWENNPGGKGDLYVRFVKMTSSSKNCWLDNCNFLESGTDPIYLDGQYLTCRNNLVDRAYNKGDGGNGYYDVRCDNSLIVNETVKRIRHFAIQQGAKNNVVINCKFDVDVNYHSGDRGDNLVEKCDITVLRWRGWNPFATGGAQYGHKKPGPNNIIYNNKTNNRGKIGEYGGNKTVYTYKGYGSPSVLSNTPPKRGTFYPIKRGNGTPPPTPTPPPTGGCDLPRTLNNITVNKQTVNYSSGSIDISCGSNITIAMTAQGAGSMEDADYLNVYYKVNGGQQIAISENKNSFGSKTISASGINGNTVELIVKGYTSFGDETYTVSNIRISGNGGTPPPPPNPNPNPNPNPTPGGNTTLIIEAENFNQTGGTFNDGQVPLGMNKTGIGVNFVNSGDWAEYNINVANAGSYAIMYRISTPSDNAQIQFVLDGNIVATDNVPNNGQWDSYVNLNSSQRVNLSQGNHTIRINASGSNAWQWNMDKITLSRGGNKSITVSGVNVYPNPANQILRLSGVAEYSGVNIYDLLGKKVLSQRLKSNEINVNDLKNGIYMLELIVDTTREIKRIIIKH